MMVDFHFFNFCFIVRFFFFLLFQFGLDIIDLGFTIGLAF